VTDKPETKDTFPSSLTQNPSLVELPSQDRYQQVRSQVDQILEVFLEALPSNYVSQVSGPNYILHFQAIAEQLAEFQIGIQEVFSDNIFAYTRPEFLFQILGLLVFPDGATDGIPTLEGDLTYRDFLRKMVRLLLQGATKATIEEGIGCLTTADIEVIERGLLRRILGDDSAWGPGDQFAFEINLSRIVGTTEVDGEEVDLYGFPAEDPFTFQRNLELVLKALKPAHTLYDLRFVFKDSFGGDDGEGGELFEDSVSWDLRSYYYGDFRKYCLGAQCIASDNGETLTDRSLFSDPTVSFALIEPGAELVVLTGENSINAETDDRGDIGRYRVAEILVFPVGDDSTARAYTTSPTGLTGTATVSGKIFEDTAQDFGLAVEGEILTLSEGPNAGSYRLQDLAGLSGGPLGHVSGGEPYTRVIASPSLLRIERRMPIATTGQSYTLTVDRLGIQKPNVVTGEDVSQFFYL